MTSWLNLGRVHPTALRAARLQAHWAAQVVAATGATLLPARSDDSHTSLEWNERLAALTGQALETTEDLRVGLRLTDLCLLIIANGDRVVHETALVGKTLLDALGHAARLLQRQGLALPNGLARPGYAMPEHPLASEAVFSMDDNAPFEELGHWYANASSLLTELVAKTPGAGPVRCWPHHFDVATLIVLDPSADREHARSVGTGLSPGDEVFDEPYWYTSPYPSSTTEPLAPLAGGGFWNRDGFLGAVLRGSSITCTLNSDEQRGRVHAYLQSAITACTAIARSADNPTP